MKKPVIICVDDEATILNSLKIHLKKALGDSYLIEIAEGGEEALELFEELLADGYEVALTISDHIMPDIKGDELLKRIHQISPETIKMMLTGQADLIAVTNAINHAQLYRYISKPWQAEDMTLTVQEAVKKYCQDKQLVKQNAKLQEMNRELEQLTSEQALLIAQLHENESRLQQFLEAIPVGVFIVDASGKPYYTNSRAQQLLGKGISPNSLDWPIMESYQIYLANTQEIYPLENAPLLRALKGENSTVDDAEIHQTDKVIPIEIWGTPIYGSEGKISYAIAAFQDITDRKKSEAVRLTLTKELLELNAAYSRFVPQQFLEFLNKRSITEVELGDTIQREMSILFSDIRDFTTLSEQMSPEDNFKFINSYLKRMEEPIVVNNGFIDKYIGDAIMALFGGDADDAVKAAIAMMHQLNQYNQHRLQLGYLPIQIGIGINTGSLMLGTVGGHNRMDGTVISDAVNLASRIEGLTKYYGVSLLISHHTYKRLQNPGNYAIRSIDQVQVKGKSELVTVYEIFDGDHPKLRDKKWATLQTFTEACSFYNLNAFDDAVECFSQCLRIDPEDKVAQIYLQRARQQMG